MKLSQEEIHFIDKYLKNSGIRYIDIRLEMVDHIVSALTVIEGDFYENFKDYMAINKKEFLKSNSYFKKLANKKAFLLIMNNMLKLSSLVILAGIYMFLYFLIHNIEKEEVQTFFFVIEGAPLMLLFGTFYYNFFTKRDKFSVTDKILVMFCIVYYFIPSLHNVQSWVQNPNLVILYYALLFDFAVIVYLSYKRLLRNYKDKYKLV